MQCGSKQVWRGVRPTRALGHPRRAAGPPHKALASCPCGSHLARALVTPFPPASECTRRAGGDPKGSCCLAAHCCLSCTPRRRRRQHGSGHRRPSASCSLLRTQLGKAPRLTSLEVLPWRDQTTNQRQARPSPLLLLAIAAKHCCLLGRCSRPPASPGPGSAQRKAAHWLLGCAAANADCHRGRPGRRRGCIGWRRRRRWRQGRWWCRGYLRRRRQGWLPCNCSRRRGRQPCATCRRCRICIRREWIIGCRCCCACR